MLGKIHSSEQEVLDLDKHNGKLIFPPDNHNVGYVMKQDNYKNRLGDHL